MLKGYSTGQIIIFFTFLGTLIPVCIGLLHYRKLRPSAKNIVWLVFVSFVFDIAGRILWWNKIPNLFVGNVYAIVEFAIISFIYKFEFKNFIPQYWLEAVVGISLIFFLYNLFWGQGFFFNNTLSKTVESVLLILFSLLYFHKTIKELQIAQLEATPMFWFNSGVLLYFSGSLFIFIFSNYLLIYSQELGIQIWAIHAFFMMLFYFTISIALWVNHKR